MQAAIRKELTVKLGLIYRDLLATHKIADLPNSLRSKYMSIPSKVVQNYAVPGEELLVDQVFIYFNLFTVCFNQVLYHFFFFRRRYVICVWFPGMCQGQVVYIYG
jgi:hypothetical protein